ncbi:hypothetical protein PshuTeo2_07240 [Pseudomonas hunanensis]|nr:hypothetical protein [Pseudomonas hunanensis]
MDLGKGGGGEVWSRCWNRLMPDRALSRVNPLLQGTIVPCRSGFTREEARSVDKESEAEHIPRHRLGDTDTIHTG